MVAVWGGCKGLLSTRIPASAIAAVADSNSPSISMNSGVPGAGPASGSP